MALGLRGPYETHQKLGNACKLHYAICMHRATDIRGQMSSDHHEVTRHPTYQESGREAWEEWTVDDTDG
jgi:hypothetical protein